MKNLNGVWINVYDRKILNDHMKCYSVRFQDFPNYLFRTEEQQKQFEKESGIDQLDEEKTIFEYSHLSTKRYPKEAEEVMTEEDRVLSTRLGVTLNFKFDENRTVG